MALTLGNVAVMQGLKLQQISLLIAALISVAIILLVSDYAVVAGAILAVATIKPQLMVLLLGWLALWTLADWRRRYRLAVSFLATMVILFAASEWYLPHWIARFSACRHRISTLHGGDVGAGKGGGPALELGS